jgi:PPOX class probable F420-dependent enzyme
MPGYGTLGPSEGHGLLSWSWAEERLSKSHNYWVATRQPDGRPHVMPVWGVWHDSRLWFSSSLGSRKTRNLSADPRCAISTDNAQEPVVVEGKAELVTDRDALAVILDRINTKYETALGPETLDPAVNASFRVRPTLVFALTEDDFTGSPTRWAFEPSR